MRRKFESAENLEARLSYKFKGSTSKFDIEKKTRKAESVQKDLDQYKTEGGVFGYETLNAIGKLGSEGVIDRIMGPIATGKEADVFLGERDKKKIAIKIFRMASASYFRNPTVLQYILGDERFKDLKRTPRDLIKCWAMKEFRNLRKAEEAGVLAPKPLAIEKNVLVMSFIGDDDAAPRLRDTKIEDPKKLFKDVMSGMKKMYKNDLVHADLSEYNLLLWKGKPYFIDFGQGVLLGHPHAREFLERDVRNICAFFARNGVECDPEKTLGEITKG